jgi:hypothetical protein
MELARAYRDGVGGQRDLSQAYQWFAAASETLEGEDKITAGKARAQIAAMLTPEQLAQARSMTRFGEQPQALARKKPGKEPPFVYR